MYLQYCITIGKVVFQTSRFTILQTKGLIPTPIGTHLVLLSISLFVIFPSINELYLICKKLRFKPESLQQLLYVSSK